MKQIIPLLLFVVPAFAGEETARKFETLDANKDGKVTKDEFFGSDSLFERWDTDKDGALTLAEMEAGVKAPRPRGKPMDGEAGPKDRRPEDGRSQRRRGAPAYDMKKLDKNGDGKISKDEYPEPGFKKLDRNKDGAVDAEEFKMLQRRQGRGGMRRGGPDRGIDWAKRIMAMDANKDGAVSKDEWKGRGEGFARLDQDKDGKLSTQEIEAFGKRARRRGGWKNRPGDALFRRLDTDKDGRISKDEWKLDAKLFGRFDANQDGFVSKDEVTPKGSDKEMPTGSRADRFFGKFDKNRDGKVDATEVPSSKWIETMDRNGDGVLTRDEVDQGMDQKRSEDSLGFIERFDADRDGKVSREEFKGPGKLFERFDANADGFVDRAELDAAPKKKGRKGKKK